MEVTVCIVDAVSWVGQNARMSEKRPVCLLNRDLP